MSWFFHFLLTITRFENSFDHIFLILLCLSEEVILHGSPIVCGLTCHQTIHPVLHFLVVVLCHRSLIVIGQDSLFLPLYHLGMGLHLILLILLEVGHLPFLLLASHFFEGLLAITIGDL